MGKCYVKSGVRNKVEMGLAAIQARYSLRRTSVPLQIVVACTKASKAGSWSSTSSSISFSPTLPGSRQSSMDSRNDIWSLVPSSLASVSHPNVKIPNSMLKQAKATQVSRRSLAQCENEVSPLQPFGSFSPLQHIFGFLTYRFLGRRLRDEEPP